MPGFSGEDINGMNDFLGLGSGALIKHRGAYGTRLRLQVPHLWLGVPLLGAVARGSGGGGAWLGA